MTTKPCTRGPEASAPRFAGGSIAYRNDPLTLYKGGMSAASPAHEPGAEDLVNALLTASRLLVAVSARSLAAVEESLTLPQFRMLVVLDSRGALTLSQLAGELGVQPSTAMRMIDRLEAVGILARGSSRADRRASIISLTPTGRRIVVETTERRKQEIVRIVQKMPPDHRQQLVHALQTFTEAGEEPLIKEAAPLGW
jgi:DNA-binding MarR family transcriptional regulator